MTPRPSSLLAGAVSARTSRSTRRCAPREAQQPECASRRPTPPPAWRAPSRRARPLLPQVKVEGHYERTTGNRQQKPAAPPPSATAADTLQLVRRRGHRHAAVLWDFGQTLEPAGAPPRCARSALADIERATRLRGDARRARRPSSARARRRRWSASRARRWPTRSATSAQIAGFVQAGTRPEIDLAQARADRANARVGAHPRRERLHRRARRAEPGDGRRGRHRLRRRRRDLRRPSPGETGPLGAAHRRGARGRAPTWRRSTSRCTRRSWRRAPPAAATGPR